jgi:hypothetical protein
MLTHPTLDQLKALKLDGMADAFVELQSQSQAAELAHAEWLALLLDREVANRNTRRFQVRLARPSWRMSITERRGGSTRHCSGSSRPTDGLPSIAIC